MLNQPKVVIVGGSSGIGLSLAQHLAEQGEKVVIGSRSLEKLALAKTQLSGLVETVQVDASNIDSVKTFFDEVGSFDHLIVTIKPEHLVCDFKNSAIADARASFDAKYWGSYHLTRLCLDYISQQGSITLTSGIASKKSYKGFSGTAAINGAIESFVQSVSTEIAPIRINALCPGFIERFPSDNERFLAVKKIGCNIPLGKLGSHSEVISGFSFLLENTYSTGTTLVIDGGEVCASGV